VNGGSTFFGPFQKKRVCFPYTANLSENYYDVDMNSVCVCVCVCVCVKEIREILLGGDKEKKE